VAAAPPDPSGSDAAMPPQGAPDGDQSAGRDRRPRHRRKDGEERTEQRTDRSDRRDRPEGGGRRDRPDRPPRRDRDRRDENRPSRTWSSSQEPRGKEPDPNSPFAKLLALKEQLQSNKEQP
jgi:ATP-dependent RNA helicase SUPV3L1/SUV3